MALLQEYSSGHRCFGTTIVFLLLVIVALVGYVAVKESQEKDPEKEISPDPFSMRYRRGGRFCPPCNKKKHSFLPIRHIEKTIVDTKRDVLQVYGEFFKTAKEIKEIEKKYIGNPDFTLKVSMNKSAVPPGYYESVCQKGSNPQSSGKRKRRNVGQNNLHYHGCCVSYRHFISPNTAVSDHNNALVNLVHFSDERQYFFVDECWHESTCPLGCACHQQTGLFRALVHRSSPTHPSPYVVRVIRIPSSCKCMNTPAPWTGD